MPIYEFYCADCHMIFNFMSRTTDNEKRPACPRCGRPDLERQVSPFAVATGRTDDAPGRLADIDDDRMERVMENLAGEMEGIDEHDPRQMARFMRRLSETAGVDLGSEVEEAIRRLEAGEDPEKIEEELGSLLDGESVPGQKRITGLKRRMKPPGRDDTLYRM